MNKMRFLMALLLLAVGVLPAACGEASASDGPPEINYGRDICIECGMIIDDPRFAATYRLPDGTEAKFDDLGDLILYARERSVLDEATVWVSDFNDEVLIDAPTAHYVPTLGVSSPMGHGILAFATEEAAHAVAMELDGEVITWETVKQLPTIDGRVGHHHHDMDHDDHEGHDHEDMDHDDHEGHDHDG